MRQIILLTLVLSSVILLVASQNTPTNCTNPIFSEDSFKARKQTRPRYLSAPANSTLNYCKVFSNKFSCCDKTTDEDIAAIFNNYKAVLANLTSKKFRSIKEGFEGYQTVSFNDHPNSDKAKEKVGKVLQDVKNKLTQTTKNAVACARHALKLSAGLLCSGCNPLWGNFVKNGKFILSNNSCLALSNACYGLLRGFDNLKNESRADVANLTDAIAEFVGTPFTPADEEVLFSDSPARILQGGPLDDVKTACPEWVKKGYFKEADCKLCYSSMFATMLTLSKSDECKDNPLIKIISERYLKKNPTVNPNAEGSPYGRDLARLLETFSMFSRYRVYPVNVKLDEGKNIWHFYTTNTAFYGIIGKLFSSKNPTAREASIADYNKKISEEANAFMDFVEILDDKNKMLIKPHDNPQSKKFDGCYVNAVKTLFSETGKKPFDAFRYTVILDGTDLGKIIGEGAPAAKKPKIVEDLVKCSGQTNLGALLEILLVVSTKNVVFYCPAEDCFIYSENSAPVTPTPKPKDQILDSFQKIKAKGGDPKRFSLATGRKVPDDIILPSKTEVATEMNFKPPCANVSDCARWFCNNFISGPLARVEKVINPQDSADPIDSQVSDAYNVQLNNSKRILADEAGNELSSTGLNFIAVAEASGLVTTVAIDGVQEEAAGFDSSINANTTLDANSSGIIVNNTTNTTNTTTNGTGSGNTTKNGTGNGSSKINIVMSVIISLFVLLI